MSYGIFLVLKVKGKWIGLKAENRLALWKNYLGITGEIIDSERLIFAAFTRFGLAMFIHGRESSVR